MISDMARAYRYHNAGNAIDKIIVCFIALLAVLPFHQVFYLQLGFITLNIFELIYLELGMLILAKILMVGKIKKRYIPFLFFLATVIIYISISIVLYGPSIIDSMNQLRRYLPFIVATMLLLTDVSITTERYLRTLVVATIFSSTVALTIHYLMPDMLEKMLSRSEWLVPITIVYGRLYWKNSTLTFFVLLFLLLPKKKRPVNKIVMTIALLLSFSALFNTVCRTLMIGLVVFIVGYVFLEKQIPLIFRRSAKIFVLAILGFLIFFSLVSINPKIFQLVEERYLGSGHGSKQVYETAIVKGRFYIYDQYARSIKTYFPIGQGLGKPFSIGKDGTKVPITDISIMAFLLPFGVLGLIVFCAFIYMLFRLASRGANFVGAKNVRLVKLLLVVSLIMSLNIDLYSRNNFVIYVTMLVLTLQNRSKDRVTKALPRMIR